MAIVQTYLAEPQLLGTQSESVSFPYTTTYTGYFDFSILLNNVGSDVVTFTISVDGNPQTPTYTVDGNEQKTIFFDGRFDAGQVISISNDSADGQVLDAILAGDDLLATENKDITNVTSADVPYVFETATEVNIEIQLSDTETATPETSTSVPFTVSNTRDYEVLYTANVQTDIGNDGQQTEQVDFFTQVNGVTVATNSITEGFSETVSNTISVNSGDTIDIVIEATYQGNPDIFVSDVQITEQIITENVYDVILRQGDDDPDVLLRDSGSINRGDSTTELFSDVVVEPNDILEVDFQLDTGVVNNVSITSASGFENEPDNFFVGVTDVEDTNEVFTPRLNPGVVTIFTREITNLSNVPTRHVVSQAELKAIEVLSSGENNVISNSPVASKFSFYNVPTTEILQPDNLVVSESILPNIGRQRAEDAVFTSEVYSSFYVRNNSNDEYAQIFFGINGGENIRLETDGFTGNIHEVDALNLNQVLFPPNLLNEYKDQAFVRTSLFNQATIEVSIAPKNTQLRPLEEENLQDVNFVQGNERLQLPNLSPGDYVGVYLKINTNFNVNLGLPVDYAFLHLSYSNLTRGEFLTIPGQVYNRDQNEYKPRLLPSLVIPFVTDYQRLLELIERTTEDLYALYPPFFEYYTNE